MALRLVLVSAVAGLGLTLPSGDDLGAWAFRAQNWMSARLAEWGPPIVNEGGAFVFDAGVAEPTPTGPPAAQATAPAPPAAQAEEIDSAFDAAQEELVASLSVDPTPVEPAPKVPLSEAEVTAAPSEAPKFDPMEVGEDLYPGLAFALNRAAEGIVLAPPAPASSWGEQWAQAIRLTREAAFAWANLLHGPAVVAIEH